MEYRKLGNTDLEISVLGYGASPLGNEFEEIDVAEGNRAVDMAIDNGVNFFDTSPYYGRTLSEERLGKALGKKRKGVVLATKCGRYDSDKFDFSADRVRRSIDESLRRLQTDYVDIFQMHDIEFVDREQVINEALPVAREMQKAGKCRYVGITALPLKILKDVAERAPVDSILSYARYNLMVTDLDDLLRPYCEESGVGLINASPLHLRVLTERGAPDWHAASDDVKDVGMRVAALCRSTGIDVADVALKFCLDYPYCASTLVGMSKTLHVKKNLAVFQFETPPDLLKRLRSLIEPVKNQIWPTGLPENRD
jgi:L-galactose dehydrogenase